MLIPEILQKLRKMQEECVHSYVKPNRKFEVCVDVGANIGGFCTLYPDKFNRTIAIEPNKFAVKILREIVEEWELSNIVVFNYAVSDKKFETINLYSGDEKGDWANFRTEKSSSPNLKKIDEVLTVDLEEVFKLSDTDYIDMLKIDCEGAEYKFLYKKDLSNIGVIAGEIHPGILGEENLKNLWHHITDTHKITKIVIDSDTNFLGEDSFLFFAIPIGGGEVKYPYSSSSFGSGISLVPIE